MKIKKLLLTTAFALALVMPLSAAEAGSVIGNETPTELPASPRAQEITKRLEEINAMDLNSKSRAEKRVLRKEVKSLEKEAKKLNNNGGVYLSVGALLLIIILLIVLL